MAAIPLPSRFDRVFILSGEHSGHHGAVTNTVTNGITVILVGETTHPDHCPTFIDDEERNACTIQHGMCGRDPFRRALCPRQQPIFDAPQDVSGLTGQDQAALRDRDQRERSNNARTGPLRPDRLIVPRNMVSAYHDAFLVRSMALCVVETDTQDDRGLESHIRQWCHAIQAQTEELHGEFTECNLGLIRSHYPVHGHNVCPGEHRMMRRDLRRCLNDGSAHFVNPNIQSEDEEDEEGTEEQPPAGLPNAQ